METKFFLMQVKRDINGTYEKGVVVKSTLNSALQSAHAYLGAYGYEHDASIDFAACVVIDSVGNLLFKVIDNRIPVDTPEPDKDGE